MRLGAVVEGIHSSQVPADNDAERYWLKMLLGTPSEADRWLGEDSDFWLARGPHAVLSALSELPSALAACNWETALTQAVILRGLQLIRVTACLSKRSEGGQFPLPPIPHSWHATFPMDEDAAAEPELERHTQDKASGSSHFLLRVKCTSSVLVTALHTDVYFAGPDALRSTHPYIRLKKTKNVLEVRLPSSSLEPITVLIAGRTICDSRSLLRLSAKYSAGKHSGGNYDPRTSNGRSNLASLIDGLLGLRTSAGVVVTHHPSGSDELLACVELPCDESGQEFLTAGYQQKLLAERSDVWVEAWPAAEGRHDISVAIDGQAPENIAVAAAAEGVPNHRVQDELMRQRVFSLMTKHSVSSPVAPSEDDAWKRVVVHEVTASFRLGGQLSPFGLEMLWAVAGGSVDLADPNEFSALLESCARERCLNNESPLNDSPHKRHRLYAECSRSSLRHSARLLNAVLLLSMPYTDPSSANQMGISRNAPPVRLGV